MEFSTNERKYYFWPTLLVFAGMILGAALGWMKGVHILQAIADAAAQKGQLFCGTGIVFLPFFLAFVGFIAGTIPGIAAAVFVYLKRTPQPPRTQSNWAAS